MARKPTVLICDDNEAVHSSLTSYLTAEGVTPISVYDGESVLRELEHLRPDVLVLDVMLPGIDGFEVCRAVRKRSDVYIIMLSAKGDESDRILGLEMGADDYVPKPFSPREVTIRIRRALKRGYPRTEPERLTLSELTVLPESYQAFVGGREIQLTAKEIEVLACLMSNAGKALTREHILNAAWGYDYYGDPRVVDSLIKRLRQKLQAEGVSVAIRSLYGVGYKIEETA